MTNSDQQGVEAMEPKPDELATDMRWRPAIRDVGARWRACLRLVRGVVVDALYPPVCMHCGAAAAAPHTICAMCWRSLRFITPPLCDRLGAPFSIDPGPGAISPAALADPPPWGRARTVVHYDGVARDLVLRMKYGDRPDLALLLGRMMASAGAELIADADALTPTPLHRWRLWRRRFNQSAALAEAIGRSTGVQVLPDLLVRRRRTRPQVGLSRAARADNLRGAFVAPRARRAAIAGRRLVLVDDVMTSGATARAAAKALLKAGAARVDILTFALTPLEDGGGGYQDR